MPREVTRIEFDSVTTKEDNPNQRREFNYIFSYDTIDPETGAQIDNNEYRTVASDVQLTMDEAKARLTDLIESQYG